MAAPVVMADLPPSVHSEVAIPLTASTPVETLSTAPASLPAVGERPHPSRVAPTPLHKGGLAREPDELDQLVAKATSEFVCAKDWVSFFDAQRDSRGDWGEVKNLPHSAAGLLHHYKTKGVPVTMKTERWTYQRKLAALARGPHKSAKEHVEFLREEYAAMIKKGHWTLIPARLIMDHPDLRLSPLGVVPQRDRRPRTISDYSYFGVNEDTAALAPQEAMQFGRALYRLLQKVHDSNPRLGAVRMAKVDIADGFYRIGLRAKDALKLAVLFPTRGGEEPLVGVPLTLPMGWKESPPAFCTATETVADLANQAIANNLKELYRLPHRLDEISETPVQAEPPRPKACSIASANPPPTTAGPKLQRPLQYWDVYVDDFLALAQGSKPRLRAIKRGLLHSLDRVFRPLLPDDLPARQEPASVKKMRKGDATWSTRKVMLGWIIDTVQQTIELPEHRVDRLHEILASIAPRQKVIDERLWHKVLGELRSMAIAIPGARGLFSLLQEAFRHREPHRPRIRLSRGVHKILDDFRWIATDIASRPTRIAELLPGRPRVYGACDAAGTGMGGAFFVPADKGYESILWRERFPQHVQAALVSFDNPSGTINNSDLELCGNVAHHMVVAQTADVREKTVWTGSDNTANVYWMRKGSTTTTGPPAYLLRIQAFHQRYHRYVPQHDYVPGTANEMADICSRAWHLTDSQLLTLFNTRFPQSQSWKICHLPTAMSSALISALYRKPSRLECVRKLPSQRMPIGHFGPTIAMRSKSTPSSATSPIRFPSSTSLHKDTEMGAFPPAVNPSQLAGYQQFSARWARRSNGWGPATHGKIAPETLTTGSHSSSVRGTRQTHRRDEFDPHR